jgi:hypothetical protein
VPDDGFHPDLRPSESVVRTQVHHVRSSDIDADTAQSDGMQRFAAISGRWVGSEKLWMGETHVRPQTVSANHHHGESETAIYIYAAGTPTSSSTTVTTKSVLQPVPATTSSYRRICLIGKRTQVQTSRL